MSKAESRLTPQIVPLHQACPMLDRQCRAQGSAAPRYTMPKKLKTLERNEGKAPLLVPHPEEEDENFRQLSLRFLQRRD